MKTKDLLERRNALVGSMRQLTEAPSGEGGDLSNEQAEKFDDMKGEVAALEKSIDRQRALDDIERRMNG